MTFGEILTRWTIRCALALYVLALGNLLADRSPGDRREVSTRWYVSRWLWTLACVTLVLHAAAAFHYYYQWSHVAADAATVAQTRERTGIAFGGGIYFNYALLATWLADCMWWWFAPASYRSRHWVITLWVHGFILFMAFQGAIVFETGMTRWAGIVAMVVLTALALSRWASAGDEKELA